MAKLKTNADSANSVIVLSPERKTQLLSQISFDYDMISLTDLWKAAGSPKSKEPKYWFRNDQTIGFMTALSRFQKVSQNHLLTIKRGKSGGTYAHPQVALEYAQYLDPKLAVAVNEIFFERVEEEKNPELIIDRAVKTYKRKGKSDEWISGRLVGKSTRIHFTSVLGAHGVEQEGFRNCTNAIYSPLFGGTTAVVREKKGLTKKESIRDNMSLEELAAVLFAESQAAKSIQNEKLQGNAQCEMACTRSAKIVAHAINQNNKKFGQ